MSMVVL